MQIMKIINKIKNKTFDLFFRYGRALSDFKKGFEIFEKTGETPNYAQQALIYLYCKTNGRWNEKKQTELSLRFPKKKVNFPIVGKIETFDEKKSKKTNETLKNEGYVFFENKLDKEIVDRLYNFALKTKSYTPPKYDNGLIYDPKNPVSEIYRFDNSDLVNNTDVQNLIMDPVLINIARDYLGSEPVFDMPNMWWSTSFLDKASSEAAQLYHFDMDRIKWLKIFIYLNDVNDENGPHSYIRGSHVAGGKPNHLLKRGYARIPDEDLHKYYKEEDFKKISGEAGTMFAGDTKCWHKGLKPRNGDRLVLEFEYASSMFGATHPKIELDTEASKEFTEFCKKNPFYTGNIHLK
jgi:hypothetical protein